MRYFIKLIIICLISALVTAISSNCIVGSTRNSQLFFAVPDVARRFVFGYTDLAADATWIRVLQDISLCEQRTPDPTEKRIGKARRATCNEGWVYHMLNFVIELTPRWRFPQRVGPLLLSVVVDDRSGATKLFDKAIVNFPNDWPILTRAGYHYLYEEEDYLKAARVYEAAAQQEGAPPWCRLLAGKLYQQSGRLHIAKIVLSDYLKNAQPGSPGYEKAQARLQAIDEQLAAEEAKNKTK